MRVIKVVLVGKPRYPHSGTFRIVECEPHQKGHKRLIPPFCLPSYWPGSIRSKGGESPCSLSLAQAVAPSSSTMPR